MQGLIGISGCLLVRCPVVTIVKAVQLNGRAVRRRAHVGKLPLKLVRSPVIVGIKESKVVASGLANSGISRGAGTATALDAEDIEVSGR